MRRLPDRSIRSKSYAIVDPSPYDRPTADAPVSAGAIDDAPPPPRRGGRPAAAAAAADRPLRLRTASLAPPSPLAAPAPGASLASSSPPPGLPYMTPARGPLTPTMPAPASTATAAAEPWAADPWSAAGGSEAPPRGQRRPVGRDRQRSLSQGLLPAWLRPSPPPAPKTAPLSTLPTYDGVSHTYEEMGPLGNLTQSIIDGWERLGRPKPGPHEFFVNGKLPDLWKPTPPSKPRLKRRDETLAIGSMSDDVPVPAAPETGDAVPGAGADPTVLVMGKAVPADAASPSTPPGRSHLVKRELQKHGKLVLDVDTTPPRDRSLGWQKDAHKNLPGFRLMATTFPDAEWYFMIDDDT
ncbi:hypothetical protein CAUPRSCDRAFT_11780, partial [Caulochytrium protostelioides]